MLTTEFEGPGSTFTPYAVQFQDGGRRVSGDGPPKFTFCVSDETQFKRILTADDYAAANAFVRGEFDLSGDLVLNSGHAAKLPSVANRGMKPGNASNSSSLGRPTPRRETRKSYPLSWLGQPKTCHNRAMKRSFSATIWREGNWFVSQCREVDVASQGETEEEALANLREALELHFQLPVATHAPALRHFEVEVGAA